MYLGICVGLEASPLVSQFTNVKHSNLTKQRTTKIQGTKLIKINTRKGTERILEHEDHMKCT